MADPFVCGVCGMPQESPCILPCCAASVCGKHVDAVCPVCEASIDPRQAKANQLLTLMLNRSTDCERCGAKQAQFYCATCAAFLCRDCSATIHSLGVFRKHAVLATDRSKAQAWDSCDAHEGQKLTLFCTDDWCSLCTECLDSHESHAVLQLDYLLEDTLREVATKESHIKDLLARVNDHCNRLAARTAEVTQVVDRSKTQIHAQMQTLRDLLAAREDELTRAVDAQSAVKMRELMTASKESAKAKGRLEAIMGLLAFAKEQPAVVLVDSLKYISGVLEHLPSAPSTLPSAPTAALSASTSRASDCIKSISLEECKEGDSGAASSRLSSCISSNSASMADLPVEKTQRSQAKSSKSPIARASTSFKSELASSSPNGKVSQKVSMTPRTPHRPSSAHTKGTEEVMSSKAYSSLSSILDDQPLAQRVFVKKVQTSSAIQVSWNHPLNPPSNLHYILEYGVGTKLGSVEQFRQVYKGTARTCIITDLLPKTSYRFRVAPLKLNPEEVGEWSEVATITTFDTQGIDLQSCGQHATLTNRGGDRYLTFDKAGTVLASNPVLFGKCAWEVRIASSTLFSQEESPSALKIGIIAGKSKVVVGSTVIYSGKAAAKVKVCLDADSRTMVCFTPTHPQGEQFLHLPDGPLLPAIMNKPGKSVTSVKIWVAFDLPYDLSP